MVKEIHLLETDKLRDSHAEEMEQLEINLNTVRMNEIRTLDEKYDTMLSSKNDEIQHMNKEIEDFRVKTGDGGVWGMCGDNFN